MNGKIKDQDKIQLFKDLIEFCVYFNGIEEAKIRYISLESNDITDQEITILLNNLKYENTWLYTLKLDGNSINEDIVKEIESYVKENQESQQRALERIRGNEKERLVIKFFYYFFINCFFFFFFFFYLFFFFFFF